MLPDLRSQQGPHVFVTDLGQPEIGDDDRHHLTKSLRLRDGDALTLSDGRGAWCTARFGDTVEVAGAIHSVAPPPYDLELAIALTKAAKPELAVQKATEIGIDTIFVFEATHSVARWDAAKREKNQQRLERVAREAAMQSRRVTIPTITVVGQLAEIDNTHPMARADFGGVPLFCGDFEDPRCVVVGPEGGWSTAEAALVPDTVDLGPTVLRAETAAIVAAAFLASHRTRVG